MPTEVRGARTCPLLSRRALLAGGAGAVAAGLSGSLAVPALASDPATGGDGSFGMLVDLTECVGCRSCVYACQEANGWTGDPERPAIDGDQWTAVREVELPGDPGHVRYVRTQCFHCLDPACASACPVGALHKTPEGPVVYDAGRCIGCRYCMVACPFHIPRYQWETPLPLVAKCIMCAPRLERGESPACAEACPTGATTFGRRSELIAVARKRIADHPDRYVPRIYGLTEAGGTSWLYLSDVPFEELGFASVGSTPPPQKTQAVMEKVPVVAVGVAALMAVVRWWEGARESRDEARDARERAGTPSGKEPGA
ncbi:4Fe-4S dicluster domain-containing protein [Carboxydochorda subterranea]|uniref:4Fe-4S dicluster domain-containing protein n=1 Tax=Carboxydichorda subterranea TaxID=3109565 RepID=A0ABZ1C0J5_9FIRM|nr:4Fe-4S dicluster domain-containing protein [Limnochorda sp. L945t]WRP18365.1 4Fe-4S dicluster domain-containing protein [Limnochorda sp. L945t]